MKTSIINLMSRSQMLKIGCPDFTGLLTVKSGSGLISWFLRITVLILDSLTPSWVKMTKYFVNITYILYKKQGLPGVVKYLKCASVLLQQSVGNYIIKDVTPLGPRISRTKGGIPRCIPSQSRLEIKKGNKAHIKFWMSLFSLYRVIEYPGQMKLSTITNLGCDISSLLKETDSYLPKFAQLLGRRSPLLGLKDPIGGKLLLAGEPFLISKSSPSSAELQKLFQVEERLSSTSPYNLVRSAIALLRYPDVYQAMHLYASKTGNRWFSYITKFTQFEPILRRFTKLSSNSFYIGALGIKEEPAGKVRVFAMVDPWTQWLLKPLHSLIFMTLRHIKEDGTFDQLAPVKRLLASNPKRVWSYDLSAATDRLPLSLQIQILSFWMGEDLARAWGKILVGRPYRAPKGAGEKELRYAVGQPMGALSSWAMLALTHHFIVQFAAYRVKVRDGHKRKVHSLPSWFSLYAVLGDDIVIANGPVAREYRHLMGKLGVEIGLAKSLVSRKRVVLEFAKKFFIPEDASPVSLKEVAIATRNVSALVELAFKYALSPSQVLTLVGYGYRVKGNLGLDFVKMSGRVSTILLSITKKAGLSWDWLLSRSLDPGRVFVCDTPQRRAMVITSLSEYINQSLRSSYDSLSRSIVTMASWCGYELGQRPIDVLSEFNRLQDKTELIKKDQQPAILFLRGKEIPKVSTGDLDSSFLTEIMTFLTVVLSPSIMKGSVILEDVRIWWDKLIVFIRLSPWDFEPSKVIDGFNEKRKQLSTISTTGSIWIRSGDSVRDRVLKDVALYRRISHVLLKPLTTALVVKRVYTPWYLRWYKTLLRNVSGLYTLLDKRYSRSCLWLTVWFRWRPVRWFLLTLREIGSMMMGCWLVLEFPIPVVEIPQVEEASSPDYVTIILVGLAFMLTMWIHHSYCQSVIIDTLSSNISVLTEQLQENTLTLNGLIASLSLNKSLKEDIFTHLQAMKSLVDSITTDLGTFPRELFENPVLNDTLVRAQALSNLIQSNQFLLSSDRNIHLDDLFFPQREWLRLVSELLASSDATSNELVSPIFLNNLLKYEQSLNKVSEYTPLLQEYLSGSLEIPF